MTRTSTAALFGSETRRQYVAARREAAGWDMVRLFDEIAEQQE